MPCYDLVVLEARKIIPSHAVHAVWDQTLPPALEVANGEPFSVAVPDAAGGQIRHGASSSRLRALDWSAMWPLIGPVFVRGATPGDGLEVEVLELRPAATGWTAVLPERGLLRDTIKGPYLHHWELHPEEGAALLRRGIAVPLAPFLGVIGCAPAQSGTFGPLPPRSMGGKLDLPQLVAGARLVLPVQVPGALLSVGHGRAAQGAGEVCGTALECEMTAVLRATIVPGGAPSEPYAECPPPHPPVGPLRFTLGSAADPREAARTATKEMIRWLCTEHRLSREVAYVLCSVAAGLSIAQAVNTPHWTVSMSLPLNIFA